MGNLIYAGMRKVTVSMYLSGYIIACRLVGDYGIHAVRYEKKESHLRIEVPPIAIKEPGKFYIEIKLMDEIHQSEMIKIHEGLPHDMKYTKITYETMIHNCSDDYWTIE